MNNKIFGIPFFKKGGIHIKEKNKGSFTKYCNGKVTQECIDKGKKSPNKAIRKKAIFALNSRSWSRKHLQGGSLWNDIKENTPTLIKDIVLVFDPTGISSWKDVYNSYKKGDYSEFVGDVLGAIPIIGISSFGAISKVPAIMDVFYDADNIITGGENSRKFAEKFYGGIASWLHSDKGKWTGYFNPANEHLNDESGKDRNLLKLSLYGEDKGLKKYKGEPIIVNGELFNDPNKTYIMNLYNNPVLGLSKEDYKNMKGKLTKVVTDKYQYAADKGLTIDQDMVDTGRSVVGIKGNKARFFDKWDFNWLMNHRAFKPTRKYPNAGDAYFIEEVPISTKKNKTDKSFDLIRIKDVE